jgi:hypothetical protein
MQVRSLLQQAVSGEAVPAELKSRIQQRLWSALELPATWSWRSWPLAAAATLALVLGGYAVIRNWTDPNPSIQSQASLPAVVSAQALSILKIGLGDHVRCAVDHRFYERIISPEQMAELLGESYAGMTSVVKSHSPEGYELTVAHRCKVDGRAFVHMILKKPGRFVSLILTEKTGEFYPSQDRTLESFGVKLRQVQIEGFQVAGFETPKHLGYFVSGLEAQENLQVAFRLTPSLTEYLAKLEI